MAQSNAQKFVALGMAPPLAQTVADSISGTFTGAVLTTGDQTIAGTKTFNTRPVVGTATAATNDTGAASTAFVLANAGKNKTAIAALTPIAEPSEATAPDCAAVLNDIIAALQA